MDKVFRWLTLISMLTIGILFINLNININNDDSNNELINNLNNINCYYNNEINNLKIELDNKNKEIENLNIMLNDLKCQIENINNRIISMNKTEKTVKVYMYTLNKNETDSKPNNAAFGKPIPNFTIAVSRDLLYKYKNKYIIIEGFDNIFYVNDVMNARHHNSIDVLVHNKNIAKEFGIKKLKIWILC